MVNLKSKLCILFIMALFAVFLSGCSIEDINIDLTQIVEDLVSDISDDWNEFRQILPDFGSIIEGILSALSGIGGAIRDMLPDFSIF